MTRLTERAGHVSGFLAVALTFTFTSYFLDRESNLAYGSTDPLPSWNANGPKRAIIGFVEKATRQGSPEFIPAADRIAVFDMDGTLLVEQPVLSAAIPSIAGIKRNPELAYRPMVELLDYLRARGFQTSISSGSPVAFTRRPVLVGGNVGSESDIAMMRYSKDRAGPSLQILINHDDSVRDYAYSETDRSSLDAASRYGFVVVSLKNDWSTVFSSDHSH